MIPQGFSIEEFMTQGPAAAITWAIVRTIKAHKPAWMKDAWLLPIAAVISVPVVMAVNAAQGKSADGILADAASVWLLATFGNTATKQVKELSTK